jgi:ABC-type branched-subunit amino acid transport system permease subunit
MMLNGAVLLAVILWLPEGLISLPSRLRLRRRPREAR